LSADLPGFDRDSLAPPHQTAHPVARLEFEKPVHFERAALFAQNVDRGGDVEGGAQPFDVAAKLLAKRGLQSPEERLGVIGR